MSTCGDYEEARETTRTRRLRSAYRGALTRLINQLDEVVYTENGGRLKQLRQSITAKMEVLQGLDEELLPTVSDDQLDHEVDVTREKAELALLAIDEALATLETPDRRSPTSLKTHLTSSNERPGSPQATGDNIQLTYPTTWVKTTSPTNSTSSTVISLPSALTCTSVWSLPWTLPSLSPLHVSVPAATDWPLSHQPGGSLITQGHGEQCYERVTSARTTESQEYNDCVKHVSLLSPHDVPVCECLECPTIDKPTYTPPPLIRADTETLKQNVQVPSSLDQDVVHLVNQQPMQRGSFMVHPPACGQHMATNPYLSVLSSSVGRLKLSAPPVVALGQASLGQSPQHVITSSYVPSIPSVVPLGSSSPPVVTIDQLSVTQSGAPVPPVTHMSLGLTRQPRDHSHLARSGLVALPLTHVPTGPMQPNPVIAPSVNPPALLPMYSHVTTPQVKLPKLSMRKFNGDLTRWATFWDSFSASIHNNPALSAIDKFNYLLSLVESSAAEAIGGLALTEANYQEAVATLHRRFGNPQLIINRHMETLLKIPGVTSHNDVRGLRKLHDSVEAHMRGLKALRVPAQTYGGLFTPILINKLPPELRLFVARSMSGDTWDLEGLMQVFGQEVDARERAFVPTSTQTPRKPPTPLPTAATLLTGHSQQVGTKMACVYCGQDHLSASCTTTADPTSRKELLRKTGRCFVCLKRHHLSRDCRSTFNCRRCRGRHHVSICMRGLKTTKPTQRTDDEEPLPAQPLRDEVPRTTVMYVGAGTQALLQTARVQVIDLEGGAETSTRAVLDGGSQRTYISCRLKDHLRLPTIGRQELQIQPFGNSDNHCESYDVVRFGIRLLDGQVLRVVALVVPLICSPLTSQPIDESVKVYKHLEGLELADSAGATDALDVDVLVGTDWYWSLVTGKVVRSETQRWVGFSQAQLLG